MKKTIAVITGGALTLIASLPVYAAPVELCPKGNSEFGALCNFTSGDIGGIIQGVIVLLLILAVVLAVVFLVWGGIKWILSGGDKTAVESARNHIVAALVGLVIAFAAFFFLSIITNILLGKPLTTFTLPTIKTGGSSN